MVISRKGYLSLLLLCTGSEFPLLFCICILGIRIQRILCGKGIHRQYFLNAVPVVNNNLHFRKHFFHCLIKHTDFRGLRVLYIFLIHCIKPGNLCLCFIDTNLLLCLGILDDLVCLCLGFWQLLVSVFVGIVQSSFFSLLGQSPQP